MKIKWGNLIAFLLIAGGLVGYFQWEQNKPSQDRIGANTPRAPLTQAGSLVFARDSWITGGIPELGLLRGYQRDYKFDLTMSYYPSDDDRLKAVAQGQAHFTEISFPSLLYNLELLKLQDQVQVLAIIDYSRGGDGIVVRPGIKTVNDLIDKRVGFLGDGTGKYLISFLLRMVDLRFEDVRGIVYKDENDLTADFAAGKLDAIAYWQPGIGEVLGKVPGSKVLLSTADMPTLIPDVLIVNRAFVTENPARVEGFMRFWFATVKHLFERPEMAYDRWADALNAATYREGGQELSIYGTDNSAESLKEIFTQEVRLVGLDENLKLMGVTQPSEIESMVKFALENWNRVEDLNGPNSRVLFNNRVLAAIKDDVTLKVGVIDPAKSGNAPQVQEQPKVFAPIADPLRLDEVAQMAIPNIEFEPDQTAITPAGRQVIETVLVPLLRQFPNFYLLIDGHTDVGGDMGVLTRLSEGRANSVKQDLRARGFPEAQLITRGFGDQRPLFAVPRTDLDKARNRRTEFRLLREPLQ